MRTLAEIIAAKKAKTEIVEVEETESDLFSLTEDKEETSSLVSFVYKGKYSEPAASLFISLHTPYLRDPYSFQVLVFREYKKWLLSPSLYVINTFKPIDTQSLFHTYMLCNPPQDILGLHRLASWLWELEFTIPEKYQRDFEEIIRKNSA